MSQHRQPLSEAAIRQATTTWLARQVGPSHLIVNELAVENGGARVDIAVIGSQLAAYELKSDFDNLDRLARQMQAFQRVFDSLTMVTTVAFLATVEKLLPRWWGLAEAVANPDGSTNIVERRAPGTNPRQEMVDVAGLLWKDEALAALRRVTATPVPSKATRMEIYQRLAAEVPSDELRTYVAETLRARISLRERAAV
jgi:hypothetical protein